MPNRNIVALSALIAIILALTGTIVRSVARAPQLGGLAPLLILTLMTWYLILLIVNRKEIIAGIAAMFKVRNPEFPRTSFRLTIIVYAAVLCSAIIILWMGVPQRILSGMQGIITPLGAGTGSSQPPLNPMAGFFPSVAVVSLGVLVITAIFLTSFILLMGGLRLALNSRQMRADDTSEEVQEEAATIIQQTITALKAEKEYHEIILQCYVKMCRILAKAGIELTPAETAREFADSISTKLQVGEKAVSGLTFLFEEARYSNHEISEEKRIQALSYLASLQRALSPNVGMSA